MWSYWSGRTEASGTSSAGAGGATSKRIRAQPPGVSSRSLFGPRDNHWSGYAATSTTCLYPHPPTCAGRCGARVPARRHRGSPRHKCLYKRLKSSKPHGEDLSLSDWPRGILDDQRQLLIFCRSQRHDRPTSWLQLFPTDLLVPFHKRLRLRSCHRVHAPTIHANHPLSEFRRCCSPGGLGAAARSPPIPLRFRCSRPDLRVRPAGPFGIPDRLGDRPTRLASPRQAVPTIVVDHGSVNGGCDPREYINVSRLRRSGSSDGLPLSVLSPGHPGGLRDRSRRRKG